MEALKVVKSRVFSGNLAWKTAHAAEMTTLEDAGGINELVWDK